jgi:aspartyl-tRNA(Asn)/glutamyl-tRNA(Gln) amidotransferase subunit C
MKQLSPEDIAKVASLAKLELSDQELAAVSAKLLNVLDLVAQLNNVDTSGIPEMAHPVDVHSVARTDRLESGLSREAALQNAPQSDGQFFLVPPVLG